MRLDEFRLTADELVLRELEGGVAVDGPARVSFCDCLRAPLAIGFDAAVLEEPGDLKLQQPRLEIGGVTVLALPWFWLRAKSQPGLLPPRVAWRGGDGLLLGGGVHLPWNRGESALGLGLAGYTQGGFELTSSMRTPSSSAHLRWDRIRGDLVALDARGSSTLAARTTLAWDIDAIRGPRARSGTLDLGAASNPYDRAAVTSATRLGPFLLGTGVRGLFARGEGGPFSGHAFGPHLSLASGGALSSHGDWDALLAGDLLAEPRALHLLRAESGMALSALWGPLSTRLSLRESAALFSREGALGLDAMLLGRAEAGLPLGREFGAGDSALVHLIEPRAELSGLVSHLPGEGFEERHSLPLLRDDGGAALASLGLRTSLGPRFGSDGGSLDAAVGAFASEETNRYAPLSRLRASLESRDWALSAEVAARLSREERGRVILGQARVGAWEERFLAFEIAGREGIEPLAARLLASSLRTPSGGWLALSGWSAGAFAGTRLARVVRLEAGSHADLSAKELLGVQGAAGYEHPCGCLGASLSGQKRLGREGVDVFASVRVGR